MSVADQLIQQGIEKGIERGIEKGIERGIEKGIEKGIEQGIERGLERGAQQAGAAHLARLEGLLGIDASPPGQLEALPPDELERRIRALEEELRRRLG